MTCVASMAVIGALIVAPLDLVLVSALGIKSGYDVGVFVSLFLSALISGYIFAGKLWEAKRESITKITVLWAGLVSLVALVVPAAVADWSPMVKEEYEYQAK